MEGKGRGLVLIAVAVACALASAGLAARYQGERQAALGETRPTVVVERELKAGKALGGDSLRRSVSVREIPVAFVPPDALHDPAEAAGLTPLVGLPAGGYLVASALTDQAEPLLPRLGRGDQPVELLVRSSSAAAPPDGSLVDLLAAEQPGVGSVRSKVVVVARRVRLLSLRPEREDRSGAGRWTAVLALDRRESIDAIEAENYARELRLIPVGGPG